MADLEDKLSRADIIDVSKLKGDQVMFGATVTLVDEDTDDKVKYRDRRRGRGRREAGPDLHHLAAGPGAARQAQEGHRRGVDARRRQVLQGAQGRVQIGRRGTRPVAQQRSLPFDCRVASARSASSDQPERVARTPGRVLRIPLGDRRPVAERAVALPLAVPAQRRRLHLREVDAAQRPPLPQRMPRSLFRARAPLLRILLAGMLPPDSLQASPTRRQDQPLLHAEEPRFRLPRLDEAQRQISDPIPLADPPPAIELRSRGGARDG